MKESCAAQAAAGKVGHPRVCHSPCVPPSLPSAGGAVWWNECVMTMQIQLQRHGEGQVGCRNGCRDKWNTPTTHRRRPSCRRHDRQLAAKWLNRDPMGERGGLNLYGFVENGPVNKFDLLGRQTVGKAYREDGTLGHAALEVGGKGYGFGPKPLRPFFSIGTTSNYETTAKPRTVWDLSIRKTGKFKDKRGGRCCDATLERVIQCADHFKATWEGTEWRLSRNCRHYVDTIISSCCLSRGAARHEQEEGGAQ